MGAHKHSSHADQMTMKTTIFLLFLALGTAAHPTAEVVPEEAPDTEEEETSWAWGLNYNTIVQAQKEAAAKAAAAKAAAAESRRNVRRFNGKFTGYPCFNLWPCYVHSKVAWKEPKFGRYMLRDAIAPHMTKWADVYICRAGAKAVDKYLKFNNKQDFKKFQETMAEGFDSSSDPPYFPTGPPQPHCGWPPASGSNAVPADTPLAEVPPPAIHAPAPFNRPLRFKKGQCPLLNKDGGPLNKCKLLYNGQHCPMFGHKMYCGYPYGTYSTAMGCWLSAWIAAQAKFVFVDKRSSEADFLQAKREVAQGKCTKCSRGGACVLD